MTLSPFRMLLSVCIAAVIPLLGFVQVARERDAAQFERDQARLDRDTLVAAANINAERLAQAAANDLKHTQELANVRTQNVNLRRAIDAGHQRLYVKAACPNQVSADPRAPGLADAGPAELPANARPDYFTLVDQLAVSREMILGLQDHLRLCQR